jgi:hypothetical protein
MIDTKLIEETEQDHSDAASAPQENATQTDAPEKQPFEWLLDEMDAMKARIALLEASLSSHEHSINVDADQFAELAMQKVNALIRARDRRV